jgi:hypothetical protein
MPRELKPEDVMRALDILDKMDFFQGQRAGRELWFEKPFEVQEQDIADFSQGIAFVKNLIADAPAILREKDAEIERLQEIADAVADTIPVCEGCNGKTEFGERTEHCVYGIDDTYCARRATEMWFAIRAENERLKEERDKAQAICVQMGKLNQAEIAKARADAITEFAERVKNALNDVARLSMHGVKGEHFIIGKPLIDKIAKEIKEGKDGKIDL